MQVDLVWAAVEGKALKLMRDVFGNYVVQKLLEHSTWQGKPKLAEKLKGQVLSLSMQMYGCRVVQTALQVKLSPAVAGGLLQMPFAAMNVDHVRKDIEML